jgi:hypothetical protein
MSSPLCDDHGRAAPRRHDPWTPLGLPLEPTDRRGSRPGTLGGTLAVGLRWWMGVWGFQGVRRRSLGVQGV